VTYTRDSPVTLSTAYWPAAAKPGVDHTLRQRWNEGITSGAVLHTELKTLNGTVAHCILRPHLRLGADPRRESCSCR
jgi:hypothetical protein